MSETDPSELERAIPQSTNNIPVIHAISTFSDYTINHNPVFKESEIKEILEKKAENEEADMLESQ
jgi:hypothetical protein